MKKLILIISVAWASCAVVFGQESSFQDFNPKPGWVWRDWNTRSGVLRKERNLLTAKLTAFSKAQLNVKRKELYSLARKSPTLLNLYRASWIECHFRMSYVLKSREDPDLLAMIRFLNSQKDFEDYEYDRVRVILLGMARGPRIAKIDRLYDFDKSDKWIERLFIRRHIVSGAKRYTEIKPLIDKNMKADAKNWRNALDLASYYEMKYVVTDAKIKQTALEAIRYYQQVKLLISQESDRKEIDKSIVMIRNLMAERKHL